MITIPTAEQEAFQSSAPKTLTLNFPFSDPITNEGIYMESAQLEQAICDESNLTFGMVYSSHFSVRIFDTGETYRGLRVNPVISVDADGTTYSRSLGYYTVKSDRLTSDKLYRDLECYDYLADVLSADFTTWHNRMMVSRINTLKQYRDAFFTYIGLEQENVTLPNDNASISPFMQLDVSGASVVSAILQMSGAFGYIGYDGKFKYVLPTKTPTVTISDNSYIQGSLNYEDEPMKKISGVKILGWEDDYGEEGSTTIPDVTAGDSTYSMLTIEDNFLIHGCNTATRQAICNNLYNSLVDFDYYPSSVEFPVYIGLEPGDVFKIETDRKDIYFPVLKRTMKGISSLRDEIEAQGEYELTDSASTGVISGTQLTIEQMRESISELLAQKASIEAQDAAIRANIAANSALTQLSIIEDVAGTLRWISENGTFTVTEDTVVDSNTIYYIYENGEYIPIVSPDPTKNPHDEGWYVLDVTDSQAEFIMAHLAVTDAGLWILPVDQMVSHQLVDSNDNDLIDSNNNLLVDYRKDEENIHQASGYKVLISGETTDNHPVGVSIYDDTGALIANYGETTTIGAESDNNVYIDPDSVDIRKGSIVLASFGTDGVLLYKKVNDSSIPIAKFTTDQYGNPFVWMAKYPNTPGGDVPYTSKGTVLDTTGLHTYGDNNEYIDPAGINKAKYTYGGIYYNDWSVAVGTKRSSESNSTVGSGTWSAQEYVNLTPGTWLVIFGCGFGSHATGLRYIVLNKNSSGEQTVSRHDMIVPALNGGTTFVQASKIVQVSDSEGLVPYYLHVYQNSGATLSTLPFIEAIKLV